MLNGSKPVPPKQTLWRRWKKTALHNQMLVILTAVGIASGALITRCNHVEDMHERIREFYEEHPELLTPSEVQAATKRPPGRAQLFLLDAEAHAGVGKYTEFRLKVGNSGGVAASDAMISANTTAIRRPAGANDEQYAMLAQRQIDADSLSSFKMNNLAAGYSVSEVTQDDMLLSKEAMADLQSGNLRIYHFGKIEYSTGTGGRANVAFCVFYDGSVDPGVKFCSSGNGS